MQAHLVLRRRPDPGLLAEVLSALLGDRPAPAFSVEALIDRMEARR